MFSVVGIQESNDSEWELLTWVEWRLSSVTNDWCATHPDQTPWILFTPVWVHRSYLTCSAIFNMFIKRLFMGAFLTNPLRLPSVSTVSIWLTLDSPKHTLRSVRGPFSHESRKRREPPNYYSNFLFIYRTKLNTIHENSVSSPTIPLYISSLVLIPVFLKHPTSTSRTSFLTQRVPWPLRVRHSTCLSLELPRYTSTYSRRTHNVGLLKSTPSSLELQGNHIYE